MLDDLGIDGDDAVAFFEMFESEFGVDLEPLYRDWSRHFGPEGIPLSLGLLLVVIASLVAVPVALAGLPLWAATGLGLAAGFGCLVGLLRAWPIKPGKELQPVTVADLIVAADTGRWPERVEPD
ncbi:MAG: hypothetical protein U1E18_18205 [Brevundimonas sp.]|nr:hypothetical protein [Brevundimonas sp.]